MFRLTGSLASLLLVLSIVLACAPPASPSITAVPPSPTSAPPSPTNAPSPIPTALSATPTSPPLPTAPPTVPPSPTASASTPTAAPATSGFPLTVTDDAGRSLTFDHAPRRIISLTPGHTETLYALGVGDRVVVTDKYSDYPAENKPKATLNTYPKPNVEELVALQPDLIVVLVEGDEFLQQMDARKIPTLKLFPKTFDDTLKDIVLLGKVTGTTAKAEQIASSMRERAAAVTAKTKDAPRRTVLYELDASDPTKPFVAGPAGFFGSLVPLAGGKNVFDDLKSPSGQVSAEQIIARNPDVIILGDSLLPFNPQTPDMVKARPGWAGIAAVRTGHVYPLDDALLERPGPRLIAGLEEMARLIHPELFP